MKAALNPQLIRDLLAIASKRVLLLSALTVCAVFLVFFVELAFALSLQIYLNKLGLLNTSIPLPLGEVKSVLQATILFLVVNLLKVGLRSFVQFLQVKTMNLFVEESRNTIIKNFLNTADSNTGNFVMLLGDTVSGIGQIIMSLTSALCNLTLASLICLQLIRFSSLTSFIVFSLIIIIFLLIRKTDESISETSHLVWDNWDVNLRRMISNVRNIIFLRTVGQVETEINGSQNVIEAVKIKKDKVARLQSLKHIYLTIMGSLVVVTIPHFITSIDKNGNEIILPFFYLFFRLLDNLNSFSNDASSVSIYRPALKNYTSWFNRIKAFPEKLTPTIALPEDLKSISWEVNGLHFSFPDKPLFKGLSFSIKPNSHNCIIGPSGCGKTTLLNLLLGLLKSDSGTLQAVMKTPTGDTFANPDMIINFLENVGYVGAEFYTIDGSIKDNILFGSNQEWSDEAITEAVMAAGANFVFEFSDGLQYKIAENGTGLSAGQKQRISIARALLKKPKVLILDEATSNLDLNTEQTILNTLKLLADQTTIVSVTHRESFRSAADNIINLGELKE